LGGYWFVQMKQGAPLAPVGNTTAQGSQTSQAIQLDKYANSFAASDTTAAPGRAPAVPTATAAPIPTSAPAVSDKKVTSATLHTSMGDMEIVFNPATPNTVANFIKLASSGFYDGTKFHRVIKGFMSQGGDPFSKDDTKAEMWGRGGPGYAFADEITASNSNDPYTVAMANSGPNTNGSQFFINAAPNHNLDPRHTVFARVIKGQDVASAINAVATGPGDRPLTPVVITGISLQ
jgi:cyclophilin family peptidyl-prolyl cis-trans isomerase